MSSEDTRRKATESQETEYETPVVLDYGTITTITRSSSTGSLDGGGDNDNPNDDPLGTA